MSGIVLIIAALATYRITMLVVADEITAPWRDAILDRYIHPKHELVKFPHADRPEMSAAYEHGAYSAECRCGMSWHSDVWADVVAEANGHVNGHRGEQTTGPKWLILLDCPWCASWWIGLPVAWSAWCFGDRGWWMVPMAALGFSAVTGIISTYAKPGPTKPR